MKQTLFIILFTFAFPSLMIASIDDFTDKMAIIGSPTLSSDPCNALDKKIMRLDRFTEVVKNTSAFHLEEKATALPTPGITVSNNRKKMLRDAKKKYIEYTAEREKYGCETLISPSTTASIADIKVAVSEPAWSSDSCAAIDKKRIKLDAFVTMVNNTSAFHLEEKASAIPSPGFTVSNNKKQMLRDAKKKYAELSGEYQKYGCETPIPTITTTQIADKKVVVSKPSLSSDTSTVTQKEPIRSVESTTKVESTRVVDVEEKAAAVPVAVTTVSHNKEKISREEKKKDAEVKVERQEYVNETPVPAATTQITDKKEAVNEPAYSSEKCDALDVELIELSEFTSMVKNTSAFHLEEKARALPSPGFTVSNNKKKMLRDIEKKYSELLSEREKYACEPLTN
ncbi:hypothetical protein [Sulfurovum sp.]|uniref:hypothetical protein n=1 Tax=Sulfurovum sp. TaxID=1969726 RepID=UPI0028683718|nr:hypothetical protein [Sulfurovum sp.]